LAWGRQARVLVPNGTIPMSGNPSGLEAGPNFWILRFGHWCLDNIGFSSGAVGVPPRVVHSKIAEHAPLCPEWQGAHAEWKRFQDGIEQARTRLMSIKKSLSTGLEQVNDVLAVL
jgi:hypothetical protein